MNKRSEIERQANLVLRQLGIYGPNGDIHDINLAQAAKIFGYDYQHTEDICWPIGSGQTSYGGQIDRQRKLVSISNRYRPYIQRFTGGHEIGHLVLHEHYESAMLHRDVPLDGGHRSKQRSPLEREADCFAGYFLMPRNLLEQNLKARFGLSSLADLDWDRGLAFHLAPNDHHKLLARSQEGATQRALAVARATQLNGMPFNPLYHVFGVSEIAMAIQLKVTGLVR